MRDANTNFGHLVYNTYKMHTGERGGERERRERERKRERREREREIYSYMYFKDSLIPL